MKIKDNNYKGSIFKKIFFDCFTGKTNDIFDLGRFLWAFSLISCIGLAFFDAIKSGHIDYEKFGIAISLILAGGGAALGFKKSTEPGQ